MENEINCSTKDKRHKTFIEIMRNYYYFQLQNEWHEHVWNIFWENRTKHKGCRDFYGKSI